MIVILIFLFLFILLFIIRMSTKQEFFKENKSKYLDYRLGDIISGFLRKVDPDLYNSYLKKYPNMIASKYIKKTMKLNEDEKDFNIPVLIDICKNRYKSINKSKNDIVIHLRIGDSLKDKKKNKYIFLPIKKSKIAYSSRFYQPEDYQKLIDKKLKKHKSKEATLIYGFHNTNFNIYVTKYADNGRAESKSELIKYMNYYKSRGIVDILLSEVEKQSMKYLRYIVPSDGSFGKVRDSIIRYRKKYFGKG